MYIYTYIYITCTYGGFLKYGYPKPWVFPIHNNPFWMILGYHQSGNQGSGEKPALGRSKVVLGQFQ
jgi:hypothetical protein